MPMGCRNLRLSKALTPGSRQYAACVGRTHRKNTQRQQFRAEDGLTKDRRSGHVNECCLGWREGVRGREGEGGAAHHRAWLFTVEARHGLLIELCMRYSHPSPQHPPGACLLVKRLPSTRIFCQVSSAIPPGSQRRHRHHFSPRFLSTLHALRK